MMNTLIQKGMVDRSQWGFVKFLSITNIKILKAVKAIPISNRPICAVGPNEPVNHDVYINPMSSNDNQPNECKIPACLLASRDIKISIGNAKLIMNIPK